MLVLFLMVTVTPHIYKNSPSSSFVLSQVVEEQVFHLFSNLSECKTSLYIPNKLIRIASARLSQL